MDPREHQPVSGIFYFLTVILICLQQNRVSCGYLLK
jgi:hypothetical protein